MPNSEPEFSLLPLDEEALQEAESERLRGALATVEAQAKLLGGYQDMLDLSKWAALEARAVAAEAALAEARAESERLRGALADGLVTENSLRALLRECADPIAYMERHHHYKLTEQERTLPERIAAALATPAAEAEKERK